MPAPPLIWDDGMALDESDTHSFIVKIWKEDDEDSRGRRPWRGHITHAFSRTRHPLRELGDILLFIRPYLDAMDARRPLRCRLVLWLSALGRRKKI